MKKIDLRIRTLENVKTFREQTKDPEIEKLFPFEETTLEETINHYHESLKPNADSYGRTIYVNNDYIGDVWCYSIDETYEQTCFLSIVIFRKEFWNQGIGTEVLKQFISLILKKFTLKTTLAFTFKHNKRSARALEKAGFRLVEDFQEDGVWSSLFKYNLTEDCTTLPNNG